MNKNSTPFDFDGDGDLDFFDYMMYHHITEEADKENDECEDDEKIEEECEENESDPENV